MQPSRELEWSFVGVLIVVIGYIVYEALGTPGGGDSIGHVLGIVGMTLMLMTEILYTSASACAGSRPGVCDPGCRFISSPASSVRPWC